MLTRIELHKDVRKRVTNHRETNHVDETNNTESSGSGLAGSAYSGIGVTVLGGASAGALGSSKEHVFTEFGLGHRAVCLDLENAAVIINDIGPHNTCRTRWVVLTEDGLTLSIHVLTTDENADCTCGKCVGSRLRQWR